MISKVIVSGILHIRGGSILSLVLQNSHFGLATFPRPVSILKEISIWPSHFFLFSAELLLAISVVLG